MSETVSLLRWFKGSVAPSFVSQHYWIYAKQPPRLVHHWAEVTRCSTHQFLTALLTFSVTASSSSLIGRLSVCLWWCPCFCSIVQVFFTQQHASTNSAMVFNANCDVHFSTVAQPCSEVIFFLHWLAKLIALDSFSVVTLLSFSFSPTLPWTYSTNTF